MKSRLFFITLLSSSLIVAVVDLLLAAERNVSLLPGLLFWIAVTQGLIALTAASELAGGRWLNPVKEKLFAHYPILAVHPFLFLLYSIRHLNAYQWTRTPNTWLQPTFFTVRNVAILLLVFVVAHRFVRASREKSPSSSKLAVLYLIAFVVSQSFLAFDWVMTFEYPWINTLFGGYFFVEALFVALAFTALIIYPLFRKNQPAYKAVLRDITTFIFGFSLLWAGLFYSQYLVIWYGNIPEEVSYIARRLAVPGIAEMGVVIVLFLFVIPFFFLIPRKFKQIPLPAALVASLIFAGLLLERILFLVSAATFQWLTCLVIWLLLAIPHLGLLFPKGRQGEPGV